MKHLNNKILRPVLPACDAEAFHQLEFQPKEEIRRIQEKLFLDHLRFCAEKSPFYRSWFKENNPDWKSIFSLNELSQLPLTDKETFSNKNRDFLAADVSEIVDVCLTSATTSNRPTSLYLTREDLSRLAYNEQKAFATAGVKSGETMLVAAAIDRCFMAGLAYFLGGVKIGNKVFRGGTSTSSQVWEMVKYAKPHSIIGVPSLLRRCALESIEKGEHPEKAGVKRLVAIGEPLRDEDLNPLPTVVQLEELWNAEAFSTYASTEMATTACECSAKQGGHIRPELIIIEIVEENGSTLPPGKVGEVVATPLGVKGMPLLRYRTGDLSFLIDEPCDCGRNTQRLGPVVGRKNQMLKFKGTTLYPHTLLNALQGIQGIAGGYVEAHLNKDGTDRVILYVALEDISRSIQSIREKVQAKARVAPEIVPVTIEEFEQKTMRPQKRKQITFFDLRN